MLNQVILTGRFVADAEYKVVGDGIPVASFTLAVDRDYVAGDGQRPVDFLDVIAWRGTAEFVHNYFSKGHLITVVGRLQVRRWRDQDGVKRRKIEVSATTAYFGSSKRTEPPEAGAPDPGELEELPDVPTPFDEE